MRIRTSLFLHILITFFGTSLVVAQIPAGKVIEGKSMISKISGKEVKYSIYLPPDYATSERRYPVVFLLHGYSDSETAWVQFGNVNQTADKAIASGDITPMIIVMPDGGVSWYINDFQNKNKFQDVFIKEFIPFIDANYRTRAVKEYRAIAGLSMGGYGSLINSLKYPEMFSACAALSAAVFTDQEILDLPTQDYNRYFSGIYGPDQLAGSARLSEHWKNNAVLYLVNTASKEQLEKVRWYIDCGDWDFLTVGNAMLHITLKNKNVYHEYRARDGFHNWAYWRSGIGDALKFITLGFDRR